MLRFFLDSIARRAVGLRGVGFCYVKTGVDIGVCEGWTVGLGAFKLDDAAPDTFRCVPNSPWSQHQSAARG